MQAAEATYRVGVDIGGTFTDFCVFDEVGRGIRTLKVLSRPDRPGSEVTTGLAELEQRYGIRPSQVTFFTHGSTVGVNTVIQRNGARVALLATRNFTDVLELARLRMPEAWSLYSIRPTPLVRKDLVFPITGRILSDGSVETALDRDSVVEAVRGARAKGAEAVAICLLNAFRNPAHERAVKAIVQELAPDLPVTCSSEVWPVIREYERTVTTVINGYIQPRIAHYITALQAALREAGVAADPLITKTNGGVMRASDAKVACVNMVLSGTASGVMGAAHAARAAGIRDALTLDIGGTSADVALVLGGEPKYGMGELIGDFPLYIPSVSVSSIGAGGGSIATVDALGTLKVGPESAGSTPGPACFGRGGERPTVTDAFAACGLLGQGTLGYSAVRLHPDRARLAVGELGQKLGLGVEDTAEAIIRIAVSGMYAEVNKILAKYGTDPRDLSLLAFGGAGPMMACFLARELGIDRVFVPLTPGVLSAMGGLVADMKNDLVRTLYVALDERTIGIVQATFAELEAAGRAWIEERLGVGADYRVVCSADMSYKGQSFEIEVPLEAGWIAAGDLAAITAAFHREHDAIYGISDAEAPCRIINARLVIVGQTPKPDFEPLPPATGPLAPRQEVEVRLDGRPCRAAVYDRADMQAGHRLTGPAIVVQSDTTTCIPGGFAGEVDAQGGLVLTRQA
ncbi:hydantoinase [Allostella vacuolata]|nr:hydantoinase [Stella vacuolata]